MQEGASCRLSVLSETFADVLGLGRKGQRVAYGRGAGVRVEDVRLDSCFVKMLGYQVRLFAQLVAFISSSDKSSSMQSLPTKPPLRLQVPGSLRPKPSLAMNSRSRLGAIHHRLNVLRSLHRGNPIQPSQTSTFSCRPCWLIARVLPRDIEEQSGAPRQL